MSFQVNSNNTTYINSFNLSGSSNHNAKRIKMYAGQTLPSGYYWCDGNNNTPDLRDKFIYGTTSSIGNIGNNSINEIPLHSHNSNVEFNKSINVFTQNEINIQFGNDTDNFQFPGMNDQNLNADYNNPVLKKIHKHPINNSNGGLLTNNITSNINNSNININSSSINGSTNANNNANTINFTQKYILIGFIMET